jgi:hypothetical protein
MHAARQTVHRTSRSAGRPLNWQMSVFGLHGLMHHDAYEAASLMLARWGQTNQTCILEG